MTQLFNLRAILALAAALLAPMVTTAATYTKTDNTNSLNQAASWGGIAPTAADIVNWSGTYSASYTNSVTGAVPGPTNSLQAVMPGGALSWQGITVGTISGTALSTNVFASNLAATNITAATEAVVNGFNLVTITTRANHGFEPGQSVTIAGVTPSGYNGTYLVAGVPSAATFTCTNATGSLAAGTAFGTVQSAIYIGGAGTATANSKFIIGSSGIDLSAANVSVVMNANTNVFSGAQQWKVAPGTVLRFSNGGVSAATARADTSGGDGLIEISGGGVVSLNQGGGTGFSDASSFAPFTGSWQVDSGTTLRGLRNGATAWGTGTITLNNGTLAVGGMSGDTGNWTWNTPVTLNASTTSYVSEQNVTGSGRSLLLTGAISGSGNLVFTEPLVGATAFTSQDLGFILSGSETMSGTVTIGGPNENGVPGRLTYVRVGGNATGTATTIGAGGYGSLGSATSVIDNGVLSFTLTSPYSLPCPISGTGTLRVGSLNSATGTGGYVGDAYQDITLTGVNTYSGPTIINAGTLSLAAGASIGNTPSITIVTNSVNGGLAVNAFDVSQLAGGFTPATGQTLNFNGGAVNGTLNLVVGSTNIFAPGGSNFIGNLNISGNLNLSGGINVFVLDLNNTPANDTVTIGGTLTASGVTTLDFAPPALGLAPGTYTLITANTMDPSVTSASFAVAGLAFNPNRPQTFNIVVSGNQIQLVVAGNLGNLLWVGDGTNNVWNTASSSNWWNLTTLAKDAFYAGDLVAFDDTGSNTPAINLTGVLTPGSVAFSNNVNNYFLGGFGQLAGAGGLILAGTGRVTINNSNNFTGNVLINGGGILAITNETALNKPSAPNAQGLTLDNGSALLITNTMTIGVNTNRGIIIGTGGGTFMVTNGATLTISNVVGDLTGLSVLTVTGNGTLIMDGNNNYGGGTIVNGEAVICGNNHAIGLNGSWSPGFNLMAGTVDIAGHGNYFNASLGVGSNYLFTAAASSSTPFLTFGGVAGATTALNDSGPFDPTNHTGFGTFVQGSAAMVIYYNGANNPGKATINAPWYAVGTGTTLRTNIVSIDSSSATPVGLEIKGQMSYLGYEGKVATIEKVGPGVLEISSTNYFPNMEVTAGTLLVNNNYALGADRSPNYQGQGTGSPHALLVDGGTVDLNGFSPVIGALSDNGGITTGLITNGSASPCVLTLGYSASNQVNNASYAGTIADGAGSGGGAVSLLKNGTNTQVLAGLNTYSGSTTVKNGILLVNSPGQIGLGTAPSTVTVAGGVAGGSGVLNAPVVVQSGGALAPGAGVATTVALTIAANLTLTGTNLMNVDKDMATNDLVTLTSGTVSYGGTLVVSTNLMATTTLVLGDRFKLFSAPASAGNFSSISGSPGAGLAWNFSPANGVLSVVNGLASNPTNITFSVFGNTLALSWPADHLGWLLQSQTNTLNSGLGANWADVPGSDTVTSTNLAINPANPAVFYRLRHP